MHSQQVMGNKPSVKSKPVVITEDLFLNGVLAHLARALLLQGRGIGFDSLMLHYVLFLEKQECGHSSYVKLRVVKKQT